VEIIDHGVVQGERSPVTDDVDGSVGVPREVRILGARVHPLNRIELLRTLVGAVETRRRVGIGHQNLHSLALIPEHPGMKEFYDKCTAIYLDGMGGVLLGKLTGWTVLRSQRVTALDYLDAFLSVAEKRRWPVYFLGGTERTAAGTVGFVQEKYPATTFRSHHGYFAYPGDENRELLEDIEAFAPRLLLVGMGMPRQEEWIAWNWNDLPDCLILSCGAVFDYLVAEIPTPPRWMGPAGIEWAFRFVSEPGRLWRRYLVEPFGLVPRLFREILDQPGRRNL